MTIVILISIVDSWNFFHFTKFLKQSKCSSSDRKSFFNQNSSIRNFLFLFSYSVCYNFNMYNTVYLNSIILIAVKYLF